MIGGMGLDREIAKFVIEVILQDREVKAELAKQIRAEADTTKNKYSQYNRASFDALTAGDVNRQYRMAQAGYDAYGRTIFRGMADTSNDSAYKNMKNKIRYGHKPEAGYENRGGFGLA